MTQFTISASTFEVAWEHAKLGEMPIVLYVQPSGFHDWERAQVVRQAWEELERVGAAHHGTLDTELAVMFAILATARRAVDARLALGKAGTPGTEVRGMAAANGDDGVLAKLADGALTIKPIFGTSLSREIVTLLPEHPAGVGRSISLCRDQIDPAAQEAGSSLYGFAERLIERGVPGEHARTLVRMIEGTKRRGQFGAAVRNRNGHRSAAERAVAFHDTDSGRYLMIDRPAADGTVWTTVAPATARLIADHVQALLHGLTKP